MDASTRRERVDCALAACVAAFIAATLSAASTAAASAPRAIGVERLAAEPAALARGDAGPVNRVAIDVGPGTPAERVPDDAPLVTCEYAAGFAYRCRHQWLASTGGGTRRRVIVEIPDLDRGRNVVVHLAYSTGRVDVPVELRNGTQIVHEIESVILASGGRRTIGADGRTEPVLTHGRERATTQPALATAALGPSAACDAPYAVWVGASATDAVFASDFGPLTGSILPERPVAPGARVARDTAPTWLITYPLAATRAQFIAHYEVAFRVGVCETLVAPSGAR